MCLSQAFDVCSESSSLRRPRICLPHSCRISLHSSVNRCLLELGCTCGTDAKAAAAAAAGPPAACNAFLKLCPTPGCVKTAGRPLIAHASGHFVFRLSVATVL
jgi:hypothetical protein